MDFRILMIFSFSIVFLLVKVTRTESQVREEYLKYTKGCGKHHKTAFKPRIVGGSTSESGKWPWAALVFRWTSVFSHGTFCVGSLIGPRHILTAAHCLYKSTENNPVFDVIDLDITLGDTRLEEHESESSPRTYNVAMVKVHPGFSHQKYSDDIAILILESEVQINEFITPICLPSKDMTHMIQSRNYSVTLIGWGQTSKNATEISYWKAIYNTFVRPKSGSSNLKELNLTLLHGRYECNYTKILCVFTANEEHQGCKGDSGGPLMFYEPSSQNWIQIGIFVRSNCVGIAYAVEVIHYLDWINSVMFEYEEKDLRKYSWWTNAYKHMKKWFAVYIYVISLIITIYCMGCLGYQIYTINTLKKRIKRFRSTSSRDPKPNPFLQLSTQTIANTKQITNDIN